MTPLMAVVAVLAAGDEWAPMPTPPPPPPKVEAKAMPDLSPTARYESALRALSTNRAGEAAAILDLLIAEFPRTAEYFAARANAQMALKNPLFAAADAAYALALKPELVNTRFTLATAEEQLGRAASAAANYRLYAESRQPDVREEYRNEAWKRSMRLAPPAPTTAPVAAPPQPQPQTWQQPAPQPQAWQPPPQPQAQPAPSTPPPECRTGNDGMSVCGYNCRNGNNGHVYCASRPDAQCAFNSNGTFTCP